jgi:hypothetical protein
MARRVFVSEELNIACAAFLRSPFQVMAAFRAARDLEQMSGVGIERLLALADAIAECRSARRGKMNKS